MKSFGLLLVVAGVLFAATPAIAQGTSFTIYADQVGGQFVWTDSAGKTNPTIAVTPNTDITVTAISKNGFHNAVVGSAKSADFDADEADPSYPTQVTLTFKSGAEGGSAILLCDYHTNMKSKVTFGAAPAVEEKNGAPGVALFGVSLALLGAALLLRRK